MFTNLVTIGLISLSLLSASREKIEVRVNDRILTSSELERILRPIYRQYEEMATGLELASLMNKARENAISNWIERQLILEEAQKLEDLQIDPMAVEQQLDETKSRFLTPEAFDVALAREGLDEEEFKKNLEEQLKVRALTYREINSKIIVSPQDIMDYFQKHENDFKEPEKVRVSHILIPLPEDPSQKETALAQAESILKELEAGGDFEALAREYSQGPRADQGGDLGYFEKGQMLPQLDEVVFSLDVGQHSGIIETGTGYHIIKISGKKKAYQKSYQEVSDEIEDKLLEEKFQKRYDEWIEKLKAKAYVVIED